MFRKIFIADDHKIIREGLRALIEKQKDIEIVGEAENGEEVVKMAKTISPDIIIMDISMPKLSGIAATQQILKANPKIKIICLSMYSDKSYVADMLKAGAAAYILKDCAFDELINAINAVIANRIYLSPGISNNPAEDYKNILHYNDLSIYSILTKRQFQVLKLIAEGNNTKEIANKLGISTKTVETFRKQIMEKLKINSIAKLTKYAIREGITDLYS